MVVDDSLEHDLLHVVGYAGTPKKGAQKSGRGRGRAPSDDSSSDEDADYKSEEEEEDEDGYRGRGGGSRRAKGGGSKMPLKKRFDTENDAEEGEEGHHGSDDGYGSELSFGSDLYKDEDDRERLQQMNELEREKILFERGERRENYLQRKQRRRELRAKQVAEREGGQTLSSSRRGAAGNKFGPRSRQDDALGQLKAKAEAKAAKQQRQQDLDNMVRKRRDKEAASRGRREDSPRQQNSSSSASESDYEGRSDDEDGHGDRSDDDQRRKAETDADIDDLQTILLRRSKLAKWCWEPFFEDVVVGCLVRLGIGANSENQPVYRICEVVAVDSKDTTKQYKFEGRTTHKFLDCKWGDNRARWQMLRISNKEPLRSEFEEWLRELDRNNCKRLTKAEVAEKRESLQRSNTFVYTSADVKRIVEEKRMAASRPRNIALEKDRLAKEIQVARERGDKATVEKLTLEVMDMEAWGRKEESKRTGRDALLANMNKRNKAENFRIASETVSLEGTKLGEVGHDPFSRRWTQSQNYYRTPNADKNTGEEALQAKADKEAALEKAKQEGLAPEVVAQLANDVETIGNQLINAEAPVDNTTNQMAKHMFQMAFSLEPLQQWGAYQEAYMARKRAQEATCGAQTGVTVVSRQGTTLTVNDYKRRRGLL